MSDFDYGNNNDNLHNNSAKQGNQEDDIEVTPSEETTIGRESSSGSMYHYSGDPYKGSGASDGNTYQGGSGNSYSNSYQGDNTSSYNNGYQSNGGSYNNGYQGDGSSSYNNGYQNNAYQGDSGSAYNNSYQGSGDAYNGNSYQGDNRDGRYRYDSQDSYQSAGNQNYGSDNGQTFYNDAPDGSSGRKRRGSGSGMGKKVAQLVGAALIFGVVAGVVIAGISVAKDRLFPKTTVKIETTTSSLTADSDTDSEDSTSSSTSGTTTVTDVSSIVDAVIPSVVSITSTIEYSSYYGFGTTEEAEGAGSGFILAQTDDTLMIATNQHVISDATSLTVGFVDDTTATATVVGSDSDADLAVISVDISDISEETLSVIKIAVLGSSDDLKVGETVIAIGNALGYGQSVTTGVISAKDREVSFTDGTMTLLQTDAAINPGNSGGVLVNLSGEVIGINNAKLEDTSVEGMGYAIPISTAETTLNDLMNAGSIEEGEGAYLGIVGRTLDSTYSEALGMPSGVYVSQVIEGSPAEEAGISAGDVITGFEGNTVSTMDGLKEKISLKEAGTEVEITLQRANQNGEYEEQTITVTLGKESDYDSVTIDNSQDSGQSSQGTTQEDYSTDPYYYYYYDDGNGSGDGGQYYYFN
ncbi:MAG: trypsin-like peptidase domain-containing protein [Clostridiales bacterium]|nr:trypsin-like peptidase domain-containing protein [Clostridiales bacterium]